MVRLSMTARKTAHPNWVLATCILASSLSFVDGSVTNVALPAIGKALGGGAADLQWVINAYLLPLSALLLLGGVAGDRYGRRRLLVGGTGLFAIASILCALAPDLNLLLAGRALQGIGAAILMPNSLAILGAGFSGERRGRAIGIWASMGAVMAAIGPVLGGWLIDMVGWRAIFFINLPLAAGAIALGLIFVRDSHDRERPALDIPGGLLATAALGALTWGLTIGSGHAGWTMFAIIGVVTGLVLLLAFVGIEHLRGERAMMPLGMFGSASFIGLTLLTLLLYGALGAVMVLVPYLLIQGGYSATQGGSALVPVAAVLALLSPLMGRLAGRMGPRLPLTMGPLVVAGGFLLELRMGAKTDYWTEVLPAILVISIGMAGAVAPLTNAVLGAVSNRYTGAASGFNSAVARAGGLIATALLGSVLGAKGDSLIIGFHTAVMACAIACAGASACAFFLIPGRGRK
ncbi:MAG: MFS transporter [Alphaproteobacteria bacterium]|nr:MFS transporter [Alphaproteobacteria bacterium]